MEERTSKNRLGLALNVRRRNSGTFLAFCAFVAITSEYPNEILTQLPGTLTHPLKLADQASGPTSPKPSLLQPPLFDRRLSLTVANSTLLTSLGPCLSSSSSSLVWNLARKPFVWVSCQNRQRNPLTGSHPHPHPLNECSPSCHINLNPNPADKTDKSSVDID